MNKIICTITVASIAIVAACGGGPKTNTANNANAANTANINTASTPVPTLDLSVVERPQKVRDMTAARGEQDAAAPTLKIVEPKADATLTSSTVKVKLELAGDLKGYKPAMDEATHTGNHIHVILDNQPYEAYYNLDQAFELRNVMDGDHVLRVFPSRPWHESYKNAGAFQIIKFKVKNGGADPAKDTTASSGQTVASPGATPEGKDVKPSNSGPIDLKKPLLTYSRPKGEYKGDDTAAVMIDFWLTNTKLKGDGGEYTVRYSVDGGEAKFIEKWEPIWIAGLPAGKHNVKIDLIDKENNVVDNGGYNSTTREITITK
jgi:hypothetical protein